MKLFVFDKVLDEKVNHIIGLVQLRKNGEVAELMNIPDNRYKISYGVSLNQLHQIAKKFEGDNDLAEHLWYLEIRETMLIATLICNPLTFTKDQFFEWVDLIDGSELAELFAKNLVSKVPDLDELIGSNIQSSNGYLRSVVWLSAGWALNRKTLCAGEFTRNLVDDTKGIEDFQLPFQVRALSFMLRQLLRSSKEGNCQVEKWIQQHTDAAEYSIRLVLEELKTELNWRLG